MSASEKFGCDPESILIAIDSGKIHNGVFWRFSHSSAGGNGTRNSYVGGTRFSGSVKTICTVKCNTCLLEFCNISEVQKHKKLVGCHSSTSTLAVPNSSINGKRSF